MVPRVGCPELCRPVGVPVAHVGLPDVPQATLPLGVETDPRAAGRSGLSGIERLVEVAVVFLCQISKPRSIAPGQLACTEDEVGAVYRFLLRAAVGSAVVLQFGH